MPVTRSQEKTMEEQFKVLMEMMREMKAGQEEMKAGQEEMKAGQEEMKAGQEEMKAGQEEMKAGQEEMKAGQEEMKKDREILREEIKAGQDEMKKEMKKILQSEIESIEIKVKKEIEDVRERVLNDVEEKFHHVDDQFQNFKKRLEDLESRPSVSSGTTENFTFRPAAKINTYDGQSSWNVFKTQFDIVSESNGWDPMTKASQLVAALRGPAAEILQSVAVENRRDLASIERALECRFGEGHLTDYYRAELKAKRQRPNESLQELSADVERLMQLAFPNCPLDVRDTLAAQYFTDAIRDEDTQHSMRLMDAKDLESCLAYAMRFEAA